MSLEFETVYRYARSSGSATTTFIIKVSAVETWVGWSDGAITSHTTLGLHTTLDINYYFDNQTVVLPEKFVFEPFPGLDIIGVTKWHDFVWIMYEYGTSANHIASINISTYAINTLLPLPAGLTYDQINSNLCAVNGGLFIIDANVTATDQNSFWRYSISSGTWSTGIVPGKKQTTTRYMADGLDGRMYITAQNDHSVVSFDTTSGATSSHKVNRHPYKLQVNQNKDLYVIADISATNNTVSLFDQATNTASTFCSGLKSTSVLDDFRTGMVWLGGGGADTMRILRADQGAVIAGVTGVPGAIAYHDVMALTDNFTYDYYNPADDTTAELTIRPHLFIRTATEVIAYRATALKGVNSSQILGTAMIATGAQGYYGG